MELVIIKSGKTYIRVKEGEYLKVNLDKASVFPMEKLPMVRDFEKEIKSRGFEKVCLKKLVLTEEEL